MSREFVMSMIGELTYFLGFQVKQLKEGTFIYQEKDDPQSQESVPTPTPQVKSMLTILSLAQLMIY